MSQPAFVPERHEVWFSDGTSGFYALKVADSVWPTAAGRAISPATGSRRCSGRRRFTVHVRLPRGARVRDVRATLAGKRITRHTRAGRTLRVPVDLRATAKSTVTLQVRVRLRNGRTVTTRRVYHPCASARQT
jgi:hypothetical protein